MAKEDRFSLIERSAMTFESFLGREFASRFYSDEFLTGISQRRLELHVRIGKFAGLAFTFATVIAFFDLLSGSSISYSGVSIQITRDLAPIIALFAAGSFLQTTFAFIDEQIIFRIMLKLGTNIGVMNFPLLLVDKAVINLWSDAITPRYFGPKSGRGQRIAVSLIGIIAVIAGGGLYLYAPAMVGLVAYQVFSDTEARIVAKGISVLSCVVVLWALVLATMSSWRFKFHAADWIESTNTPTEEFAARMRAELRTEDERRDSPNTGPSA